MENIYDTNLHDVVNIDQHRTIVRVPGGWIYETATQLADGWTVASVFVPYNEEFKEEIPPRF